MGGEADMVRRMRVGQIQAALLSGSGVAQIDDSVTALQTMPMMYRTFEEFEHVQAKLRPMIEKRMLDKGFIVLFLADAGWVKFFSKRQGALPDDFLKMKMFAWVGDPRTVEVMKAIGVPAVPLEQTDILTGLQTGLIDSVPTIPVVGLTGQFYTPAPNLLDLNWTPLMGATVITKKAWDSIPEKSRAAMLAAAAETGKQIRDRSHAEGDEAVEAMKKRGLKVTTLNPEQVDAWNKFAESVYPKIRGKVVPADIFDDVQRILAEYRKQKGEAK
jgi:TRAP-type C4-dicarboxylate transport system substrate-binding protein